MADDSFAFFPVPSAYCPIPDRELSCIMADDSFAAFPLPRLRPQDRELNRIMAEATVLESAAPSPVSAPLPRRRSPREPRSDATATVESPARLIGGGSPSILVPQLLTSSAHAALGRSRSDTSPRGVCDC